MELAFAVMLLALIVYIVFTGLVGRARMKYNADKRSLGAGITAIVKQGARRRSIGRRRAGAALTPRTVAPYNRFGCRAARLAMPFACAGRSASTTGCIGFRVPGVKASSC
jgi:hypothetical protein